MTLLEGLINDEYGIFYLSRGRECFEIDLKGDYFLLKKYCNQELVFEIEVSCLDNIKDLCFNDLIFIFTADLELKELDKRDIREDKYDFRSRSIT